MLLQCDDGGCRVHVYRGKRCSSWPLIQMLMDIVWIGVIGPGTRAKAMAFMYSEVVTPAASLRHNGVLQTPPASSVGKMSASCVVLAMSHCQVSRILRWKNVHSPHRSVGTDQVT